MRRKVAKYIEEEKLFNCKDKIIVTLSGGADSVALLIVLKELGYQCIAAHCNFHLRGEESDRDQRFVEELCKNNDIELHIKDFDTNSYAKEHKVSIEMAARELRYDWFEALKQETSAQYIAVAHHKNDNTETVLINLIRGTGIKGLLGIKPKLGAIVRPLLCVDKNDILDYLNGLNINFVTDSTNLENDYTRNKIRNRIIPALEEINPSFKESISQMNHHLTEASKIYNYAIKQAKGKVVRGNKINIKALLDFPSPEALLHEILSEHGFSSKQISAILLSTNSTEGKEFISKKRVRLVKDKEEFIIAHTKEDDTNINFSYTTQKFFKNWRSLCGEGIEIIDADCIDLSKGFSIRKWQIGDKFTPLGMKGKKLISDYMTDKKFNILQKEQQMVLLNGNRIVWLINERVDNNYKITSKTQNLLVISTK